MNKIGTLDIIKAYLGNKLLSANNAYIGEINLIKGSGPEPVPVPNNEIWYTSSDGNIVTPNNTTSLPTIVSNTYVGGKGIIKFASEITSIGDEAFAYCTSLASVTIGNSVTSIGMYAFTDTGLTSVTIPNSVTSIGSSAFEYCSSLTSVTIPNSVTSIGDGAFNACSSLTTIDIPNSVTSIGEMAFSDCSGLTGELIIPNSVTSIENSTFAYCSGLTSVTIPNSVTRIGDWAFSNCTSLTSISYTGTIPQYIAISKGNNWHLNVPATVVHCTDVDVPI